MHIVTRILSVIAIAMCCCAMPSVVAADKEKKLLASKQVICGEEVEVYKLDIRRIESLAKNGFFVLRSLKDPYKTLYQVFDGERPIRSDLYVLTHAASYLYPNAAGRINWLGRYYLEPVTNGNVEKEYGPENLYIETFPIDAAETRVLNIDGRVIGTANDGSTKLHVVWRIGKAEVFSIIKMPKKTGVVEQAKTALSKLFASKK